MNQQDEDEVIMDTLAGESSLKKIVELLEDLSRRIATIEANQISKNNYWNTYGTSTTPHIQTWNHNTTHGGGMTTSNTTKYSYNTGDISYTYYEEIDDKQA
jgi:hypothetical protein